MTPHQYVRMLRRRWRALVACLAVGIGLAVLVTVLTPTSYSATAEVYVSVNYYAGSQPPGINSSAEFALAQVQNYVLLAKSPPVLNAASRRNYGQPIRQGDISASNPPNTSFVNVTASGGNARRTASQANAVAASLTAFLPKVEARLPDGRSAVNATVVRRATTPSSPDSPKLWINLLVGVFLGLAAGLAIALIGEQFTPTGDGPAGRSDEDPPGGRPAS